MFLLLKKKDAFASFSIVLQGGQAGEGVALEAGKGNVFETISGSGPFIPEQTRNHPGQSKSLGRCSLGKVYFCWPLCSSAFGMLGTVNLKKTEKWRWGDIHTALRVRIAIFCFSCYLRFFQQTSCSLLTTLLLLLLLFKFS